MSIDTTPSDIPAGSAPESVDRSCGTCGLCCKVYNGPIEGKVAGLWCHHAKPGTGCTIYETRPEPCRAFHCLWIQAPFLGPEWKPDHARFVMTIDAATNFMLIQLDPNQPLAWKREPYYSQIKRWAIAGIDQGRQVIVFLNKTATVILPNKDVTLGELGPDDRITIERRPVVGGGFEFFAQKITVPPVA